MPRKSKTVAKPGRWFNFDVRLRRGAWIATFPHPTETRRRTKGGTSYIEPRQVERVLKHEDGRPAASNLEATALAERVYNQLEIDRVRARERGPETSETLDGPTERWRVDSSIDDWLKSYSSAKTRSTNTHRIKPFKTWCLGRCEFADDLTLNHAREFHDQVGGLPDISDRMRQWHWQAAGTFLSWMVNEDRLSENPIQRAKRGSFIKKGAKERTLGKRIHVVHRAERTRLMAACRGAMERVLLVLYNSIGLRASEACHLRWRDFKEHTDPPRLAILHTPERNHFVKTGERLVPVLEADVLELLREWRNQSPFNAPDDWIFVQPDGQPFDEPPREWIEHLQSTVTHWTPTIGRHTACSVFPLNAERLTGRRWTELEHSQIFGHNFKTSLQYYITEQLVDLASLEREQADEEDTSCPTIDSCSADHRAGFTVELARRLLRRLLDLTSTTINALAPEIGVGSRTISKWLSTGKALPPWYWDAVGRLSG